MIPTRICLQIHDSRRLLITYWFNDFLRGKLVSFWILFGVQTSASFRLDIIICFVLAWRFLKLNNWRNKRTVSPECTNYIGGPGACSPEKFLKIGLSKTPYPAFPGSNAINSYVYFIELFSESRYSWFPSRSTKIHDSQVFKTKIHDSYMFCNYDSWFRFHPRVSINGTGRRI